MFILLLRRTLSSIPVFFIVAVFVFALMHLTPGDPAAIIAGDNATTRQIEEIRRSLGLDRSLIYQFLYWCKQVLSGDFGISIISGKEVSSLILGRASPSLFIAVFTIIVSTLVAIPLGLLAAWKHNHLFDRVLMLGSVVGFSVPVFITEYVMILWFGIYLQWLPVQGYHPPSDGFWMFLKSITIPVIALSAVYIALIARITRTSILNIMDEDYIRTARAKGLSTFRVQINHALRNASMPIATIIGIGLSMMIGGVVITETVFNIPGLGRLAIDAILARDYPLIQALLLLFAAFNIIINLLIDLSYLIFDPRVR